MSYGRGGAWVVLAACVLSMMASVPGQSETALPALRGEEAIEQLKQRGEYDSLLAAANAAREKGQREVPAASAAVGE